MHGRGLSAAILNFELIRPLYSNSPTTDIPICRTRIRYHQCIRRVLEDLKVPFIRKVRFRRSSLQHDPMSKPWRAVLGWGALLCFTSLNILNYAGLYHIQRARSSTSKPDVVEYCK